MMEKIIIKPKPNPTTQVVVPSRAPDPEPKATTGQSISKLDEMDEMMQQFSAQYDVLQSKIKGAPPPKSTQQSVLPSQDTWNTPPSRYAGDPNNNLAAINSSYYWAAWDHDSGRSITISIAPDGAVIGAGYTRGGGPNIQFHKLDNQESRNKLWNWLIGAIQ